MALFLTTALRAETCGHIDHRDHLPPVRHQGRQGWCYANAAADLLSFETGVDISPVALGIEAQLNDKDVTLKDPSTSALVRLLYRVSLDRKVDHVDTKRGGTHFAAVEASRAVGLCRNSDLPGRYELWDLGGEQWQTHSPFIIETLQKLARSEPSRRAVSSDQRSCNELDSYRRFFPGVSVEAFRDILRNTSRGQDPVLALYKEACRDRVPFPDIQSPEVKRWSDAGVLKYLDDHLERAPIGIAYNAKNLVDPRAMGPANHASTIVGRQINPKTGRCEYLIRNSWGASCEGWDYSPEYACERGNIWVPAEVIARSVTTTTLLQPK